ncbi:hypothetical protein [Micromonospora gifhornensis]|uniref:hypothetical protein n=1 Tax=Micromonospora gifhornensis TaxID=84594 RepID=UPI003D710D3F
MRDEMRRWAGPSEIAQRIIVQERMIAQAFAEVIGLATPVAFGGDAYEREAVDPLVAAAGAKAAIALGDRMRAVRFADAMRGTAAEPLLRAIAADPDLPREQTVALWRAALDNADDAFTARACLLQLAVRGALVADDLSRFAALANLDGEDRLLFAARNTAAAGDLDTAVALLQGHLSPATGEILTELLNAAGRFDEALGVCDEIWNQYGTLKALQDKINILAARGDFDGAEVCAAQLLASGELPAEQRRQLHHRMIERRASHGDWVGVVACCRAALRDQPDDEYKWMLICAQINHGRWDVAWGSYRQLRPEVDEPGMVRAWVELHLRFGMTSQAQAAVTVLRTRFAGDEDALAQLARLDVAPS